MKFGNLPLTILSQEGGSLVVSYYTINLVLPYRDLQTTHVKVPTVFIWGSRTALVKKGVTVVIF